MGATVTSKCKFLFNRSNAQGNWSVLCQGIFSEAQRGACDPQIQVVWFSVLLVLNIIRLLFDYKNQSIQL